MGHDHPVIAASPEALRGAGTEDPAGARPEPRRPLWRALALALLLGAAAGALESSVRLQAFDDPSVARRAAWLVLEAAIFYGVAGLLLGALLVPLSRLLGVRYAPWFQRALAGLACLALALASFGAARAAARAPAPIGATRDQASPARAAPAGARNLLLVVVDTLRADALGAYGGPPTPHLDRLAARGTLFEEAVAPSSWTLPSMASLFTGTYPARHGFTEFSGNLDVDGALGLPHLAEALQRAGWATRAVVGNTLLGREQGFARGFDFYDAYDFEPEARMWLQWPLTRALRALGVLDRQQRRVPVPVLTRRFPFVDTRLAFYNLDGDLTERVFRRALPAPSGRPLFLYVHYLAPHAPYLAHPLELWKQAPEPEQAAPAELRARYAGEVAYTDRELGRLLARLEHDGLLAETVVCVTADHGEAFGEHGRVEHGHDLHRETVRVPWILAGPGVPEGLRVARPVSLVDLAPTLLELAGAEPPAGFEGRSLVPALTSPDATGATGVPVFAETSSRYLSPGEHHRAAYAGSLRLLRVFGADGALSAEAFYDAASDPEERAPLTAEATRSPGPRSLAEALTDYAERSSAPVRAEAAGDAAPDLDAMRALGYVDGPPGDEP